MRRDKVTSTRSRAELDRRRRDLCRLVPERALATIEEAELFLVERGMLTLTPDSALPSLFGATHEEPFAPGRSGFGAYPKTKWWWGGALGEMPHVVPTKLHRGKSLFLSQRSAALVDPLCRRELEAAVAGELGDPARRIVDHLEAAGPSLLEELKDELGLEARALRSARQKLEARGAISSVSVRLTTPGGSHTHSSRLTRWDRLVPSSAESRGRSARGPRGRGCSRSRHRRPRRGSALVRVADRRRPARRADRVGQPARDRRRSHHAERPRRGCARLGAGRKRRRVTATPRPIRHPSARTSYDEPSFFVARFSARRSFSVFCGCFFCDFFGFSAPFAITGILVEARAAAVVPDSVSVQPPRPPGPRRGSTSRRRGRRPRNATPARSTRTGLGRRQWQGASFPAARATARLLTVGSVTAMTMPLVARTCSPASSKSASPSSTTYSSCWPLDSSSCSATRVSLPCVATKTLAPNVAIPKKCCSGCQTGSSASPSVTCGISVTWRAAHPAIGRRYQPTAQGRDPLARIPVAQHPEGVRFAAAPPSFTSSLSLAGPWCVGGRR